MPRAGFYAIHTDTLKFAADGRWYADDEPVVHERLARLFSRYLRRKPGGGYEIWIDERYHADVEVEDTPYVIIQVTIDDVAHCTLALSDGSTEPLDAATLAVGGGNVLYCRVKQGAERARFLRSAYYQIAPLIEERAEGGFQIRCGDTTHVIAAS